MKFHIQNLGKIKNANIDIKDLTIICGPNSSNKTWLSYFINHCLVTVRQSITTIAAAIDDELSDEVDCLVTQGSIRIDLDKYRSTFKQAFELSFKPIKEKLPSYFKLNEDSFSALEFDIETEFDFARDKAISIEFGRFKLTQLPDSSVAEIEIVDLDKNLADKLTKGFLMRLVKRQAYSLIAEAYLSQSILKPFVLTSERTGCMVFQPEIDRATVKASEIAEKLEDISEIEALPEEVFEALEELSEGSYYTYAAPVRQNVNIVRDAQLLMVKDSYLKTEHPLVAMAMNKINGGTFSYSKSQLMFTTEDEATTLPVMLSSSSIKSLFLLDLYINSMAQKGDLLLIDEPELNLHPDNQRLMARVIARLVNAGVKVLITTHSDYLVREINNSIMLSNDFDAKEEIMTSNELVAEDILMPQQVSAYKADENGNVSDMKVGPLGINTQIFDSIINKANQLQSEIYFNLDDVDE
ncbi:TPA: AAA family ATPase [Vibrio parahaemolyticus]|nr:AAA family ATPase [Vibrio parahaemolyticus]